MATTTAAGTARFTPRAPALRVRVGRGVFIAPPLIVVLLVLVGPVILLSLYSLNLRTNIPFAPTGLSYDNWQDFLRGAGNPFRNRFVYSMEFTLVVSIATTVAAYPLAYYLAFHARRFRYTLLLLLIVPFFTSYLLRIVAWSDVMLNENGVVNQALRALGVQPRGVGVGWLLYSNFSIFLVLFYSWIPFVALPIFAVLYNVAIREILPSLALVFFAGSIGVCVTGTAISAISAQARMRELLLPLLLLPLLTPVLIASTEATAALLAEDHVLRWDWLGFLLAFDVIFLTALWLFGEYLLEE